MKCPHCYFETDSNICQNCGNIIPQDKKYWSSLAESEKAMYIRSFVSSYKKPSVIARLTSISHSNRGNSQLNFLIFVFFIILLSFFFDGDTILTILFFSIPIFYIINCILSLKSMMKSFSFDKQRDTEFYSFLNDNNIVLDTDEEISSILSRY